MESKIQDFIYDDIVDVSDNFKMKFENAGIMINGKIYTSKIIPKENLPQVLNEIIEKDGIDEKYFLSKNL